MSSISCCQYLLSSGKCRIQNKSKGYSAPTDANRSCYNGRAELVMSLIAPAQRDRLTSPLMSSTAPSFAGSMNDARLFTPAPGPKPRRAVATFVAGIWITGAKSSTFSSEEISTGLALLVGGRLGILDIKSLLEPEALLRSLGTCLATGLCCTGELGGDEGAGAWSSWSISSSGCCHELVDCVCIIAMMSCLTLHPSPSDNPRLSRSIWPRSCSNASRAPSA